MKIVIRYSNGKLEIFRNVINVEDARSVEPRQRNVGLVFETKKTTHRRDFKDIQAFQIVGANKFQTVLEKGLT